MNQRLATNSSDGSRDALYERRSALSRDLLEDDKPEQKVKRRSINRRRTTPGARSHERSRRVRLPELAFGFVLIIGGALGATTLAGSKSQIIEVVGASHALSKGAILTQADLSSVRVESRFASSFVMTNGANGLLGRVLNTDLASGAPLVPGMLETLPELADGEAIVAVRVEVGDVPASISVGDTVRVALVPDPSLAPEATTNEFKGSAIVWNVQEPSDEVSDYVVSLKVAREFLTASATSQRIKIALLGPTSAATK